MKKILFLSLIGILYILLTYSYDFSNYFTKKPAHTLNTIFQPVIENDTSCYNEILDNIGFQEFDASAEKERLKLGRNIFFHETSCFGDKGLYLNPRQACAVESAAKMNPNMIVYVLFSSSSKISDSFKQLLAQLLSYKNIKIRRIFINNYLKHTPLEEWYASGIMNTSHWPKIHMSDMLRYLTLWKFGGIYLDLDVVILKSLEDFDTFSGAEDEENVAAGVMGFGLGELGRNVIEACLKDLKENFQGWIWAHNGPWVLIRVLQKLCNTTYARDMTESRCQGFKVYPPSEFYPVHYPIWKYYFQLEEKNETIKRIKNATAIHVWNKLSKSEKIQVGSQVPYAIVAQNYCPKVYNNCGPIF